jgi:urease accessory protein
MNTTSTKADSLTTDHQPMPVSRWPAHLSLRLALTKRGVVISQSSHCGPLYVQKAFYPEGRQHPHLYILHPPGGLVSGDTLQIDIGAEADSKVLITTPGAGRVYRARVDNTLQRQSVTLSVAANACIEWLPLETIIYPGANTHLDTQVTLAEGASFIGWDICCLGLPASGQSFSHGCLQQNLQINIKGRIALRERLVLNDGNRQMFSNSAGFAAKPVNALMVAGPFIASTELDLLLEKLQRHCVKLTDSADLSAPTSGAALCSVSHSGAFILLRYLGHCAEQARQLYRLCWGELRPVLLGVSPCPPRIWAT